MLQIQKKRKTRGNGRATLFGMVAVVLLIVGGYILMLIGAPVVAPITTMRPITVASLPKPVVNENRIVIPKIGVNIAYGAGAVSLDKGAQWRYPDRGNPEKGGNFIIAAHRFSIQPTPQATIEKSPFYNIDKLVVGDKIVVDYEGKRYGYSIEEIKNVAPTAIEVEAPSESSKLTLYSCSLSGSRADRVVLISKPLGLVAIEDTPSS